MSKTGKANPKKKCFIITPIGQPGSIVRERVDQWMNLIYKPAINTKYEPIRADSIAAPGLITDQIIDHILDDDLAIIDYTGETIESGPNPNVMYEAAIRHIAKKPVIQIYPDGQAVPFDIKNWRSIRYNPSDLEYPKALKQSIQAALKEIETPGYKEPELLKHQFDLERIVSDPEAFVRLLKKHFTGSSPLKEATIDSMWTGVRNRIKCPKCGVIKSDMGLSFGPTVNIGNAYKCNNCGTEFEV
ncbi:hypothetical protein KJ742_01295 [Patescibacteria group bacterium]|nr:hypothetical protein [Patescibacteria group bacterium]MBU1682559.1 hypothetical protein [Patescibacteria group bacterium]MBU1935333.1 hypothetical protein [Patescibacteria group bacterium]